MNKIMIIKETTKRTRYRNIGKAAKRLGRSSTQVARHISGEVPSMKLAKDMERLNVEVAQ